MKWIKWIINDYRVTAKKKGWAQTIIMMMIMPITVIYFLIRAIWMN